MRRRAGYGRGLKASDVALGFAVERKRDRRSDLEFVQNRDELLVQIGARIRCFSRCFARARLSIEEILDRAGRIFQHIETNLQKRGGGGIDLRDIHALLDRRPHEPCGAKAHAALKFALLVSLHRSRGSRRRFARRP